jgi:excisionase family DNA binding protein
MSIDRNDYLTTGEAAARMGISRQAVLDMINAGKLPAVRPGGPRGRYLVHKRDAVVKPINQPPAQASE